MVGTVFPVNIAAVRHIAEGSVDIPSLRSYIESSSPDIAANSILLNPNTFKLVEKKGGSDAFHLHEARVFP